MGGCLVVACLAVVPAVERLVGCLAATSLDTVGLRVVCLGRVDAVAPVFVMADRATGLDTPGRVATASLEPGTPGRVVIVRLRATALATRVLAASGPSTELGIRAQAATPAAPAPAAGGRAATARLPVTGGRVARLVVAALATRGR